MLLSAMLHWGEILGGLVILLVVLYDIFQSVVLPRPAINKLATVRYLVRGIYWMWRWVGNRISSIPRRERWLATYGPVAVLTIFIAWGLALVLAYGMIIDGVRDEMRPVPESFGTSVYFSATTLVPLSYGDFVPEGVPARLATIAESATGVILAALAITLLFSLYQSFQRREELVVTLDAFAGAPTSGVQMLETVGGGGAREPPGVPDAGVLSIKSRQRGVAQLLRGRDGRGRPRDEHGRGQVGRPCEVDVPRRQPSRRGPVLVLPPMDATIRLARYRALRIRSGVGAVA